jgi:hypothetical protein
MHVAFLYKLKIVVLHNSQFHCFNDTSGGPPGGPDFKNLDKWVLVIEKPCGTIKTCLSTFSKVWPRQGRQRQ